jgi:hypothetical protein
MWLNADLVNRVEGISQKFVIESIHARRVRVVGAPHLAPGSTPTTASDDAINKERAVLRAAEYHPRGLFRAPGMDQSDRIRFF